jgi:ABC-2 type transport system permease protein
MLGFTVINDPHGTIAVVFSMIPLTSPIVMLMRIPLAYLCGKSHIVTLLFGSFFVSFFAAKCTELGYLCTGKKPTWSEMYRWLNKKI